MATQGQNSPHHPDVIGNAFALRYYKILNTSPEQVHMFYHDESTLGRAYSDGALTSITSTDAIAGYFLSTELKDCWIQLASIDTQLSLAGGVLIVVTGFFTMPDKVKHRFTQSFFLAPQEKGGYFILNDVLRYVLEMPSAETNEVDRSNGNSQIAPFLAKQEITSVKESMDPSVKSISVKDKVIISFENEGSQIKDGIIKIPEVAPATPTSVDNDVINNSCAYPFKTKNESTQTALITKPRSIPTPTVKQAENMEKHSSVPVKTTRAADTVPPDDKNVSDDQGYSIYVKNLPFNATVEMVEAVFRKFGTIKPHGIQLVYRQHLGLCFGFVEFESQQSMYAAIKEARISVGSCVYFVEKKQTSKRVANNVTHSNYNGNARDSQVRPGRGGYGYHLKEHRADFMNNVNCRDSHNFRGHRAGFVNNHNYQYSENFRGRSVNSGNYRYGNDMRNESRNPSEYSGRGQGLQGNDCRPNRDGCSQNMDGYHQNRDRYLENRDGYSPNSDPYHQNRDDYRRNGSGYH